MANDIFVVVEHLRGQVAEITYVMLSAARDLSRGVGGDVVAVLLGHGVENLAGDLAADRVLYVDNSALAEFTSDAYSIVLADIISRHTPRAVLFGDTSIGAGVGGVLSARLGLPLVSSCRVFNVEDGKARFVCPICGGKIMAEGEVPGPSVLVAMIPGGYKPEDGRSSSAPEVTTEKAPDLAELKIQLQEYVEPEVGDVDIAKESILVSVGRGIQREDNIELAEELAEAMGGEVSASRPVVDQGWLPISRMVGKSGKAVSPALYLALGISGAPEHVEGMSGSETVIAINTDPTAPIFDIAQYGAVLDIMDFMPVLTEQIRQAKGG